MKYIFYSSVSLFAVILTFLFQNILLLSKNSLLYIYEGFSAVSLYASLCALYFSLRFFEEKRRLTFNFLFLKIFLPTLIFSILILLNVNFNFISVFSLFVCFLLSSLSLIFILLGFLSNTAVFSETGENSSFDELNHRVADDHELSDNRTLPDIFSKREKEVAVLILQGMTTQETAESLFISPATVKTHIQHIYEKAGVRNRAELAQFVGKNGNWANQI